LQLTMRDATLGIIKIKCGILVDSPEHHLISSLN